MNPEVADVLVVSDREIVINSLASGETDAIVWLANQQRIHVYVLEGEASEHPQRVPGMADGSEDARGLLADDVEAIRPVSLDREGLADPDHHLAASRLERDDR